MADARVKKLASILVKHSLKVKKNEKVLVVATSELAKPLVLEVYKEVLGAGGHPSLSVGFEETVNIFYALANNSQIKHFPEVKLFEAEHVDCVVNIRATANKKALTTVEPAKVGARSKVVRPISEVIVNKKRWVLCNFPTHALAQEAEMSLEEYENFLYGATNIDWTKIYAKEKKLQKRLDKASVVRIVGIETDITIGIKGRKAVPCYGIRNMPDGEVYVSPLENSAEGHIYYSDPQIYQGREVLGIRLKFSAGQVVEASAEKNEEFLVSMLDTDEGARYLGELGIGVNYGIKQFSKDILFDEKIGGTVHLAVGRSYESAGGKNLSTIHWDMIKDLRKKGAIYLDGKQIQKNGRFTI
ncbi:MAG: aminopeptidase [Proteobacteria bacterium]|nr:aminopeptidase [Pseudomonadota bacterium]